MSASSSRYRLVSRYLLIHRDGDCDNGIDCDCDCDFDCDFDCDCDCVRDCDCGDDGCLDDDCNADADVGGLFGETFSFFAGRRTGESGVVEQFVARR